MRRFAPLMLGLLAACSLEPKYVRPEQPVPPGWPAGDAYLRQTEATLPAVSYRDIFRDARLQTVIARALANNQDVAVALANVEQARALYRVQRANLLPSLDGSARVSVSDSGNGSTGASTVLPGAGGIGTGGAGTGGSGIGTGGSGGGTGAGGGTNNGSGTGVSGDTGTGTGIGGGSGTGVGAGTNGGTGTVVTSSGGRRTVYTANATAAFELDLFGRLRSLNKAALQQYFGTEAAVRSTRLTLVGEVASTWLTLATDRSLLAIAVDTEASARRSYDLTDARRAGGISPRSDVRQAETVLRQAQSDRAALVTQVAQDRNALELLVGAPVPDAQLPASIESVDGTLAELPAGLDSRILLRRPDVVEAEYALRAANARIGAARAAFFPTIGLTAVAGLASTALSSLFSGGAFNWSVTPSVSLPIFDGGANRGNLAYAEATRDRAVALYRQTIQVAFREVADALARRGTIDAQADAQIALEAAARDNYTLADARYREGIDTFLTSLDAQRTLYSARRTLASTRLVRADNLVTLYGALGGDELITPPAR